MRIAIGGISHETNTFSNVPTDENLFEQWAGEEIIRTFTGVHDYVGGMIDECNDKAIEIAPAFVAEAPPAGTIPAETWVTLQTKLLESLVTLGPVDAICLALHGAGVVEGEEDLEGSLLKALRQVFGNALPIVATLDLHGNLTQDMVDYADMLFVVHHYPHIDAYQRGREAIARVAEMVEGKLMPRMRMVKIPLMIPTSTTMQSPAQDINELCWSWETRENVIDCTFFHGFPYTDIRHVGVATLAITNGDDGLAELAAQSVAQEIWRRRKDFDLRYPEPAEAVRLALAEEGQPIVINETSDNPGGGTPGDGTYLLSALLAANQPGTCFGFLRDPEVVEAAVKVGIGGKIAVKLGGKTDSLHGKPLSVEAYVKCITDGLFIYTTEMGAGGKANYGTSVRLVIGNVDVIVCATGRSQTLDDEIFRLHGIDIARYKVVALKSSQHFRAFFTPVAAKILTADSPGLTTVDFSSFRYQRIPKPICPLDISTTWDGATS